jgi:hypothetical protein
LCRPDHRADPGKRAPNWIANWPMAAVHSVLRRQHESPRTTKLYDRTGDEIILDEVERIAI